MAKSHPGAKRVLREKQAKAAKQFGMTLKEFQSSMVPGISVSQRKRAEHKLRERRRKAAKKTKAK